MTAPVIELETLDFVEASRALRQQASEPVENATRQVWQTLERCAGMAGSDPGGTAWAGHYDRAAGAAVNGAAAAGQGVDKLAAMFAQTARNYEAADIASTASARRAMDAAVATLPCLTEFWLPGCLPASAAGGSAGGPPGWGLIEDAVGYVWPNGHQDRLRDAAAAWRHSSRALTEAAQHVIDAPLPAIGHRLPESDDMWTVCSGLSAQLRDLAAVHAELASACEEFAHHLDRVHSEVIGELRSLVEWSAAIQAAGGLLSFVTVGVAEVPTQAAQAARVARAAATVGACIERFVATARTLAAGVGRLVERADGVGARLRVFVGARLAEPALAGVGPMRVLSEAREVRALGRLEVAATDDVRVFADKTAARSGLDGALRTASNRFFRDATGKCRDFRIARLPGGHFRMEFFAPATNAGYGKLYVQVIDSTGRVTVEFKDTMGPAGLIERKWLHGQPE